MAQRTSYRTPKYRRQRRSNGTDLAFVQLAGRRIWIGRYDTPASRHKYDRVIAEWLGNGRNQPLLGHADTTVVEICLAYWEHVEHHYRKPNRQPTDRVHVVRKGPSDDFANCMASVGLRPLAPSLSRLCEPPESKTV